MSRWPENSPPSSPTFRTRGQVTESLLAEYAESLAFSCPEEVGEPRALIVVASPSPVVKVRFQLESGPFEAVIPPTLHLHRLPGSAACAVMRSVLEPAGFKVARARIPVKLLAVRTGLAQYGRNNIAYVRNLGSFVRLDAFCTDAPSARGGPQEQGELALELLSALPQLPPRLPDAAASPTTARSSTPSAVSRTSTSTRASGPSGWTRRGTTAWWAACAARRCARRTGCICASRR